MDMKRFCYKCTSSILLFGLSILVCWFTWGVERLSVIGGCLILTLCLSCSFLLWRDASTSRNGEKDG